jgi:hypothetical protein
LVVLHSVLLSQFVIGLISTNQHWFACAPLSEAELERFSLNASILAQRLNGWWKSISVIMDWSLMVLLGKRLGIVWSHKYCFKGGERN